MISFCSCFNILNKYIKCVNYNACHTVLWILSWGKASELFDSLVLDSLHYVLFGTAISNSTLEYPPPPQFISNGLKSKSDQNQIDWLMVASDMSAMPSLISFHLASLSSFTLQTSFIPTGIPYLYSFTHSSHSLFYLVQATLSPLPPTALSANNLKFVCHRHDTEEHCPSYYPSPSTSPGL